MNNGRFCFISDQCYDDFQDKYLMRNKEVVDSDMGSATQTALREVLGKQAAFLIQNMCPVTERYISEIYADKNGNPIQIDERIVADVTANAREVLAITKRGARIIFPDVKTIINALQEQFTKK